MLYKWQKDLPIIHIKDEWYGRKMTAVFTYRLVAADGVDLGPKHDCSEDQKEETLKAEEDEEDDSCWGREVTALWRGRAKDMAC